MNKHHYCVILAGGTGKRLWPYSRDEKPKQFIDFFGVGRTLLQQTYDRFTRFIPQENILISTYAPYADFVREQLPEIGEEQILSEPVQHSTAPAAAWATLHIHRLDPEACIIVSPVDQIIFREEDFERELLEGLDYVAQHDDFLVMGIHPTDANTGYGYIQKGECTRSTGICQVKSFTEKPDAHFAELFLKSGEFVWNTGLLLWRSATLLAHTATVQPMIEECRDRFLQCRTRTETNALIEQYYPMGGYQSIDLALLEQTPNIFVKECSFGWADMGCWPELHAVERKNADGNAAMHNKKVLFTDCRDTMVRIPQHMAACLQGLDGYLVAMHDNVLVVCPNNDPSLVRKLLNEAQMRLGEEYI